MSEESEAGSAARAKRPIAVRVFNSVKANGPLATVEYACEVLESSLGSVPGRASLLKAVRRILRLIEYRLDKAFDRKHRTDTSGVIALKRLAIRSDNVGEGIWYEPMSSMVFRQIMEDLKLDFARFQFLDFGCGKGRVLLMAAAYGFDGIVGVEFSEELSRIAMRNVDVFEQELGRKGRITLVHRDAADFRIPDEALVIFLYSPFKGQVMKKVLDNIVASYTVNPREIVLIFHGQNVESIEMLKATGFPFRELHLAPDWSRIKQYRTLVLTSPPAAPELVRERVST